MSWAVHRPSLELVGRRVLLRPLVATDFDAWRDVRTAHDWLVTKWEPKPHPRPARHGRGPRRVRGALQRPPARAPARHRLRLRHLRRRRLRRRDQPVVRAAGPVPERLRRLLDRRDHAGQRLHARGRGGAARFAFDELALHRLQIAIIPATPPAAGSSRSSSIREEGTAVRYLEINGVWEDHVRYAITAEEWAEP